MSRTGHAASNAKGNRMKRLFAAILGVTFLSASLSACESDMTSEEQNEISRDFRSLNPGGR